MATQTLAQIRFVRRDGASGSRLSIGGLEDRDKAGTVWVKEAAGQTSAAMPAGALVYLASGKVTVCTAATAILGQTRLAASGTTDTVCEVFPISPMDVFVANVYHTTAASAVSAQTQLGLIYGLAVVSGNFHVDIETTAEDSTHATGRVRVVGFWSEDTIGDIYGRVLVKFIEWSIGLNSGDPTKAARNLQMPW